ncbi:hypothetical protein DMC15_07620 [Vibrio sp. 11986-1-5]|nr:hypothetical protein DMC15_07620 [Vibrio sp. 11986-1-5]
MIWRLKYRNPLDNLKGVFIRFIPFLREAEKVLATFDPPMNIDTLCSLALTHYNSKWFGYRF